MIGFDVDGVLAGFGAYAIERLGLDPALNTRWDFKETYGEAADKGVGELVRLPQTWVSLPVLPGAREAIRSVVAAGQYPVFITAIPQAFALLRQWWIETHLGVETTDYALMVSRGADKAQTCLAYGVTHFIEDRPDTAEAIAQAGVQSFLVPSLYMGTPSPAVRVATVEEYARIAVEETR